MTTTPNDKDPILTDKLTSEDFAALIVDALLRAHVVKQDDVDRAVKIVAEEIEVRRSLGDT